MKWLMTVNIQNNDPISCSYHLQLDATPPPIWNPLKSYGFGDR